MEEKIVEKLSFLKQKREEYVDQVKCLNGAIQCLEELLKEENEEEAK